MLRRFLLTFAVMYNAHVYSPSLKANYVSFKHRFDVQMPLKDTVLK